MATPNYPLLADIKDEKVRNALRILFEKHAKLSNDLSNASLGSTPLTTTLNGGNQRVTNIVDPVHDQDAVNKRSLVSAINAKLAALGLLKVPAAPVAHQTVAPGGSSPPVSGTPPAGGVPGGGGGGSHVFMDAGGNFLGFGASLFWFLWGFINQRDRLAQNLTFLSNGGVQYIRAFGTVGGLSWDEVAIDSNQAGYQAIVAAATDWAYDNFGLRVQWTILGTSDFVPNAPARAALVHFFGTMVAGREQKIFALEIANEAYNNGLGVAELRQLTQNLMAQTACLVAPSAPEGDDWGSAYGLNAIYAGLAARMATVHFGRGGDVWRPVRQAYGVTSNPSIPGLVSSNEPIGPGSSGSSEDDPLRLAANAAVCYLCGVGTYVYHADAGIRGLNHVPHFAGSPKANWWEVNNVDATFTAMRNVRNILPTDISNWNGPLNTNPNFASRPYDFVPGPPNDASVLGYLARMYSAEKNGTFFSIPFGITRDIQLQARRNFARVQVFDILSGSIIQDVSVNNGDYLNLSANPPAVIVKSVSA